MKKSIEDGDSYGGGGFKYMFYFQTQEDAEVFKKRWPGSYQPELLITHHYINENEKKRIIKLRVSKIYFKLLFYFLIKLVSKGNKRFKNTIINN